jgi:peptide/nickel transport system substrate-binding protein
MAQRYPEVVRIVQARVQTGDPQMTTDNKDVLSIRAALYDGLVHWAGPGSFVPAIAEHWSCADDARSWTFRLRNGVRFHSGRQLSAADVVASLRRLADPAVGGELATQGVIQSYLEGATIDAVGELVAIVRTAQPLADLLDLLADIPILDTDADPAHGIPGTGPFRLITGSGDQLIMERFGDYWGAAPEPRELHWLAVPDGQRRATALLDASADLVTGIPVHLRADAAAHAKVLEASTSLCVAFLLNCVAGACSDRRVRRALNYGLNVQHMIDTVMDGGAIRTNGPFTALHVGFDPDTAPYPYDPNTARQLLAEAGYDRGLDLVVDVPTSLPDEAVALGRSLQEHYAQLGISVTLREFNHRPAYAEMVRNKQIDDASCFDSSPLSTYRVLREKLHSGVRGPWWQGYANPDVDALVDRASATIDNSTRQHLYRHAYRLIRDDAPWVFLYSPAMYLGIGPSLVRWQPGFNSIIRFD